MKIEFDPGKDAANRNKHGISLAKAADMDFESAIFVPDERFAYGEPRTQVLGAIEGRLHMLVFTTRGETMRPISLRKANDREVKRYVAEA